VTAVDSGLDTFAAQLIAAVDQASAPSRREALAAGLAVVVAPYIDQQAADSSTIQSLKDQLAACQAQVSQLQADLAACQGSGTKTTLFGSSFGVVLAGQPPVMLGRAYLQDGERPTDYTADSGTRKAVANTDPAGTLWISPKTTDASWLAAFAASLPDGMGLNVSPWHEPENDGANGHDLAEYATTYRNFAPVCGDVGALLLPIVMGSRTEAENRRYIDAALANGAQALGWDRYNPGIQNPTSYVDPAVIFERQERLGAEYGLPGWIGETGSGTTSSDTSGAQRLAWIKAMHAYLAGSPNIRGAAWWTGGSSSRCKWTDLTMFDAWVNG
jgi:hypothetical protein